VPGAREPLPDVLRAWALLGVLLVNTADYPRSPFASGLDAVVAADYGLATLTLHLLVNGLLQGKAYPLMAFLFGMGLALAARARPRHAAQAHGRLRLKRLLALGVLNGLLIYFGDILTLYALVGWLALRHVHTPWRVFRRTLRRALWAAGLTAGVLALLCLPLASLPPDASVAPALETLASVDSWPAFWGLTALAYGWGLAISLITGLPLFRLLMLAGIAAARLRWLTHRRWQGQRRRLLRRWVLPALVLNGLCAWAEFRLGAHIQWQLLLMVLGQTTGPLLSMVLATALAQWPRGLGVLGWTAPLGQRTLTLYLAHGGLCALVFSGAGLGWQPGLWVLLLVSGLLWLAACAAAAASGHRRWPLEAWMARP